MISANIRVRQNVINIDVKTNKLSLANWHKSVVKDEQGNLWRVSLARARAKDDSYIKHPYNGEIIALLPSSGNLSQSFSNAEVSLHFGKMLYQAMEMINASVPAPARKKVVW